MRSLKFWLERRRLTLAKAVIWLAKKIYDGPYNPPAIYNVSEGILSHALKVRICGAEHRVEFHNRRQFEAMPPEAQKAYLEDHRRQMLRTMMNSIVAAKMVEFKVIYSMNGSTAYRAMLRVVEMPQDIAAKTW